MSSVARVLGPQPALPRDHGGAPTRGSRSFGRAGTLALVAVALTLRVIAACRAPIIESDGVYYASLARAALTGDAAHALSTVWPPGYPWLVALVAGAARLLGAALTPGLLETAGRAVSVAAGVTLLWPVHRLARQLAGASTAAVAAWFVAVNPRLVQFSGAALTESTFTLLLLAALTAAWCARRPVAAGVGFGLATLVRPEGAVFAMACALAAPGAPGGRRVRGVAAGALAFVIVVLPYAAFVTRATGTPSLGEKGAYNFWRAYRTEYDRLLPSPAGLTERVADGPEIAARVPAARVDVAGFVRRAPGIVLGRAAAQFGRLVGSGLPLAAGVVFVLLAILGVAGSGWARTWRLVLPIAVAVGLYAPFSSDARFLVPVAPFVLVLAAAGVTWLGARGASGDRERAARGVAAITAIVAVGHVGYVLARLRGIDDAPEHRAAGAWLRTHPGALAPAATGTRPIVLSRKPWVAFYADAIVAELPAGGPAEVERRARDVGAAAVVVDARWAVRERPLLGPWLDPQAASASLAPVMRIERPQPLELYRVIRR